MKLIRLTLANGTETFVSTDHIIRFYKGISDRTQIILTNNTILEVEESTTVVADKMTSSTKVS